MASPPPKVLCVVCNKGKGSFKCEGCLQTFCPKHSNDHRNELSKQLDGIEIEHDLIKQTLIQQTEDPQQHPLLKQIDQWEQTAIIKINQTAENARNELLKYTVEHTINITQKLKHLSDELRQGREDNDFIELDLQQWSQQLEKLKKELLNPINNNIQEDSTPLVTNIRIYRQDTSDVFSRVCGIAQIQENGCLVMKSTLDGHVEILGKKEYITGRRTIRFQVEKFVQNGWIHFGIISKSKDMRTDSYNLPSNYGWSNKNQIYVGNHKDSYNGQTFEILQNDIILLLIDCDERKIELQNERLNRTIELSIDINKCPFPWQFHLNLHAANTQVRILNPFN